MSLKPAPFPYDVRVLIMAGSDPAPARQRRGRGVPLSDKAFLRLRGRMVIEYVLDLLRECQLTQVWVLARESNLALIPQQYSYTPIPQGTGANFGANLTAALRALAPAADEPILVLFGDHPLQTPAALRVFLARAREATEQADLIHGLSLTPEYREFAPWFRRTSVHMREVCGRASGFSLAVPSRLHRLSVLGELYEVRKLERLDSVLRLIFKLPRLLGSDCPGAFVDAVSMSLAKEMEKAGRGSTIVARTARRLEATLAARVPVERLERYAARVLGAERGVRIVPVAHGGIAIDVDFDEELAALEAHWEALRDLSARQDAAFARS